MFVQYPSGIHCKVFASWLQTFCKSSFHQYYFMEILYFFYILQRFAFCTVKLLQKNASLFAKKLQTCQQNSSNDFPKVIAHLLQVFLQMLCKKHQYFLQIYYIRCNQYHILQSFALHTVKRMQKNAKIIAKVCNFFCKMFALNLQGQKQIYCKFYASSLQINKL